MTRLTVMLGIVLLSGTVARAQSTTQQQPQTPPPQRPGTILDSPSGGRITEAPVAPQQDELTGEIVEAFEAVGNSSVASDTIRVYLGIVPGEAYNADAIQRNFMNLWQTGLFDDIRIDTERGQRGVIVRVTVKERPRIGAVEFRGNKELNNQKINEALERENIDLHIGNTIEQTLVRRAAEAIRQAYTEGGFEGVQVDAITEDMALPGDRKIVFVINEGMKARVASIDFVGNQRFSDRRLRGEMKDVKSHNLITWVRKKNLYIPSKLDADLERVRNFYQDHGYQDVTFGDPQITPAGNRVKITIPVTEGEVHTFGEVSVAGNTVFTSEQILSGWPLQKGDTLRRKPIQDRVDGFGEAYRMRGYIYAYVDPEYTERPDNVVDVTLRIYEGDQFRLGRMEFEGNTTTKDKVLRREIFLEEGQIMDMETFKQSLY
jgi:outer membrane protein insertion porin family